MCINFQQPSLKLFDPQVSLNFRMKMRKVLIDLGLVWAWIENEETLGEKTTLGEKELSRLNGLNMT